MKCAKCDREMVQEEKDTSFALWKVLSDAREKDEPQDG
jgi:hypothetical protein